MINLTRPVLLTIFFLVATLAFSQSTNDPGSQSKEPKLSKSDSLIQVLTKRVNELSKEENTKEHIGKFQLYNTQPSVYSKAAFLDARNKKKIYDRQYNSHIKQLKKGNTSNFQLQEFNLFEKVKSSIIIHSISLNIHEGVIENIRVIATDTLNEESLVFENNKPIPLLNMDGAALNSFLYNVKNWDDFLKINDFMYFLPKPGQYYIPDDTDIELTKTNTEEELYASVDLNSNINVRIYSDLLSLFGKEANGLVQTEAKAKIIINSIPQGSVYLMNFIEAQVRYSKFDSDFGSLEIEDPLEPILISLDEQLRLNQISYLNLDFKLNLLKIKTFGLYSEYNVGFTYDFADIITAGTNEPETINFTSQYFEIKAGIAKSKYFGLEYSLRVLFQQNASTGLDLWPDADNYLIPTISAYFFPREESSSQLFLRFRTVGSFSQFASYPLLQFGVSSKLSLNK